MNTILRALQLLLIPCCASQFAEVQLVSDPQVNDRGIVIAKPNQSVSLTCKVEGAQVEEELQWYRDGQMVLLKDENRLNQSSLCVQPVSKDDHRITFMCRLARDVAINASVQLEVHFAPEHSGTTNVTVEQGDETTFTCDVHAYPPVTVSWFWDDVALDLSTGSYSLYRDGWESRLSIAKTQRENQGLYTCLVNSPEYGNRTKLFLLTVEDRKIKFPLGPIIAGLVVVFCTALLAILSRWKRITQCCK